ncbi:MAG: hypothetical protein ACXAE3_07735 [Candidatus Kariarchaeaceae archaeon]|jgi:hypothetical protein
MAEPVYDDISRIYHHLSYGEFAEAQKLIQTISRDSLSAEDQIRVILAEALSLTYMGMETAAEEIMVTMVNSISSFPKSNQLHILHVSAQLAMKTNSVKLARIYTEKFMDIYQSVSALIQDKANAFYGDILNIDGQLLAFEGDHGKAMMIFEEAMMLHKKLDIPFSRARSMYFAGKSANVQRMATRSETLLVDAYNLFKDIGYIEGQMNAAQELVVTYDLQEDHTSRDFYYNLVRELSQQVALQIIEQQNQLEIYNLRSENATLRQQLQALQSQMSQGGDPELEKEVEYLRAKVADFHDIKSVYNSLKDQISQMEETIAQQNVTIEQLHAQLDAQTVEIPVQKTVRVDPDDLEELRASDRLIDTIYNRLREISSAKIRILAMQLQISQHNCNRAIEKLEDIGAVSVDSWNFASPTVSVTPHI